LSTTVAPSRSDNVRDTALGVRTMPAAMRWAAVATSVRVRCVMLDP
jgi:hypothetical protein